MKNKIILIILVMFMGINVSAKCSYKEIAKLKSVVANINTTYDAKIQNSSAYFDVTISNLTNEIYFIDNNSQISYYPNSYINGEIKINDYNYRSVKYKFYSAKAECYGEYLGSQYVTFPIYNIYYDNFICDGIQDFYACNKWVDHVYNYDDVMKLINDYKKEQNMKEKNVEYRKSIIDRIIEFYTNNYIYVLGFIVVVGGAIVLIFKNRSKVDLDI